MDSVEFSAVLASAMAGVHLMSTETVRVHFNKSQRDDAEKSKSHSFPAFCNISRAF